MLVFGLTFVGKVLVKNICLVTVAISCVRLLPGIFKFVIFTHSSTEETRIRWVQTQNSAEDLFSKIKEVVNSGVYRADDALHRLWSLLIGGWEDGKGKAKTGYENVKDAGKSEWETKKKSADPYEEWAEDPIDKGREKLGEKVQVGGEKMEGEL